MVEEVKHCIVRFDDFKGRSTRREYWGWHVIFLATTALVAIIDPSDEMPGQAAYVVFAVMQIPTIAVGVRRMHDIGLSGWWHLVPIVNWILAAQPSKAHIEPGHSNLTGGPAYI
jgi:uncharacterized membrane protein YhaH (DUF805 family)